MKIISLRLALISALAGPMLVAQPTQTPTNPKPGTTLLTLESLYHPTQKVSYLEPTKNKYAWLPDGALLETRSEKNAVQISRIEMKKFERKPYFDVDQVIHELVKIGAPEDKARAAFAKAGFAWDAVFHQFVLTIDGDFYDVELGKDGPKAQRFTSSKVTKDDPTFSPDGKKVAFLQGSDIHVVDLTNGKETRLTQGGSATLFNGRLDWVYQEEVYGRGTFRAFWWAPDSQRIAYLSLDDSKVPMFTLVDDRTEPQKLQEDRYPRPGDPNPIARLGVVDLNGATAWMEDPYNGNETLIVQVGWDLEGKLIASYQDRIQTWLELRRFNNNSSSVLIKETGKAWQPRLPLPVFLKNGGFLWTSDRTGHHHIYRYDKKEKWVGPVTAGSWEVHDLLGVDEKAKRIYFSATENNPAGLDAYSVDLNADAPDSGMVRHTQRGGTHKALFSPTFEGFVDTWSNAQSPAQIALMNPDGAAVKVLDAHIKSEFREIKFGHIEFQTVLTRDGFPMPTMLVLPPDFDPLKKYPIVQHIYGGPQAPQVADAFNASMLWYHFLAQQGYVVWICDNRSASGKGLSSAEGIYKHLGEQELRDQLDGLAWLGKHKWADMNRVALEGWSYGGFMTAYSLTHCDQYKVGVVGAPVTDWRLYDSIYTERYMGSLKDNNEGYDGTSVIKAAKNLHGKVLLLHGTLDDNVHPQNTLQFLDALQQSAFTADMVLLPGSGHGPRTPEQIWARYQAMWDFIQKNL